MKSGLGLFLRLSLKPAPTDSVTTGEGFSFVDKEITGEVIREFQGSQNGGL
jgi:hypothetical protein